MLLFTINVIPGALSVYSKAQVRYYTAHVLSEQQIAGVKVPVTDAGLDNIWKGFLSSEVIWNSLKKITSLTHMTESTNHNNDKLQNVVFCARATKMLETGENNKRPSLNYLIENKNITNARTWKCYYEMIYHPIIMLLKPSKTLNSYWQIYLQHFTTLMKVLQGW